MAGVRRSRGGWRHAIRDRSLIRVMHAAARLPSPAGAGRLWLAAAAPFLCFGWIKEVLGFRRFSFRGLEKVQAEWDLVCLALNIRRMGALAAC